MHTHEARFGVTGGSSWMLRRATVCSCLAKKRERRALEGVTCKLLDGEVTKPDLGHFHGIFQNIHVSCGYFEA